MRLEQKLTNAGMIVGGLLGTFVGLDYAFSSGLLPDGVCPTAGELKVAGLMMIGGSVFGLAAGNYAGSKLVF